MSANESFCSQSESLTPPSVIEMANTISQHLLPEKSREISVKYYQRNVFDINSNLSWRII